MKNTISKHHEAVLAFLKANPNSTFDTIKEGCKTISDIMLRKAVKDLQAEGVIAANDEDGGYIFAGALKKGEVKDAKPEKKEAVKAETKATVKKNEDEDLGPATISGKDFTRYDFNGLKGLSKGKLALEIIKKYMTDKPKTSFSDLEKVFQNKTIQVRYGVFEDAKKAAAHTINKRERYFFKDLIKVGNSKICVTNQWSASTLKPLLSIAKEQLKYKITVSK